MIPPGYSDVSRVLAFASATDIDVTSLLSKLTPTVKGLLRAGRKREKNRTKGLEILRIEEKNS